MPPDADGDDADPDVDLSVVDPEAARWDAAMAAEADQEPAAIAFVGRPNVGKSSLLNALLGEERSIVSEIPGTTRDAIDTRLAWGRSEIVLIDTAGIRRRGKVAVAARPPRSYSTLRALQALTRADVAVLVIDAVEGFTVAGRARRGLCGRGGQGPGHRGQQVGPRGRQDRPDVRPVRRVDPQRGPVPRLRADPLDQRQDRAAGGPGPRGRRRHLGRAPQAGLDGRAQPAARSPPRNGRRRRRSAAGARRSSTRPRRPWRRRRSCSSASDGSAVHFSYRRYLENQLRETFGFDGTPIKLVFRDRTSVKLPRRKKARPGAGAASPRGAEAAGQDPPVPLMGGPRVAVVGAGAWGTTLARLVAREEPVTAAVPLPGDGGTDRRDRSQRGAPARRGPAARPSIATADPAALADATDLVVFADPSRAPAARRSRRVAPYLARVGGRRVGREGPRAGHACCG